MATARKMAGAIRSGKTNIALCCQASRIHHEGNAVRLTGLDFGDYGVVACISQCVKRAKMTVNVTAVRFPAKRV